MRVEPYTIDRLSFAYCCHVYFRWHTYFNRSLACLANLTIDSVQSKRPDIHILNLETTAREIATLVSIRPTDSVSTAASKLKGGISKTVRALGSISEPAKTMGNGYFACTTGASRGDAIERYLDQQSQHHGYDQRTNPPVFRRSWTRRTTDDQVLGTHTVTNLRWHLVFADWGRKGTFSAKAAESITDAWDGIAADLKIQFVKVSFVADHVHLAIRSHPTVVPAKIVEVLLNASQQVMLDEYAELVLRNGSPQVWAPSAYIGSYGDLANRQIQAYLDRWALRGQT